MVPFPVRDLPRLGVSRTESEPASLEQAADRHFSLMGVSDLALFFLHAAVDLLSVSG